jgi:hypothetical protein
MAFTLATMRARVMAVHPNGAVRHGTIQVGIACSSGTVVTCRADLGFPNLPMPGYYDTAAGPMVHLSLRLRGLFATSLLLAMSLNSFSRDTR